MFKIQDSKPAFKVSLIGVHMGTPDYDSIWAVIIEARDRGLIDSIVRFAIPIEGGVGHCIQVGDSSACARVLDELTKAPTSLEESHYSIESVDSCPE